MNWNLLWVLKKRDEASRLVQPQDLFSLKTRSASRIVQPQDSFSFQTRSALRLVQPQDSFNRLQASEGNRENKISILNGSEKRELSWLKENERGRKPHDEKRIIDYDVFLPRAAGNEGCEIVKLVAISVLLPLKILQLSFKKGETLKLSFRLGDLILQKMSTSEWTNCYA